MQCGRRISDVWERCELQPRPIQLSTILPERDNITQCKGLPSHYAILMSSADLSQLTVDTMEGPSHNAQQLHGCRSLYNVSRLPESYPWANMEAANDILGDFLNLNPTLHSTQTKDEAYGPSSVLVSLNNQ